MIELTPKQISALKIYKALNNLTLTEMAGKLGINRRSLAKILKGQNQVITRTYTAINQLLSEEYLNNVKKEVMK